MGPTRSADRLTPRSPPPCTVRPEKLKEFVDRVVALAGGPASGKRALEEAAILLGEGKLPEATQAYADLTALPEHAASATAGLAMCALTLY